MNALEIHVNLEQFVRTSLVVFLVNAQVVPLETHIEQGAPKTKHHLVAQI